MMARTVRDVILAGTKFDKKWNDAIVWRSRQSDWALCTGALLVGGLGIALTITLFALLVVIPASAFSIYCYKLCRQRARHAVRAADRAHRRQLRIIEEAIAAEEACMSEALKSTQTGSQVPMGG